MGIRLRNELTKNKNMFHISIEIKRQVDIKLERIRQMELQLIYSPNYKGKGSISFYQMMDETYEVLDITQPSEKYHNTNKNQNLY